MGSYGIDNWYWRMEEHKRKGHKIIEYPEDDLGETVDEIEYNDILKKLKVTS